MSGTTSVVFTDIADSSALVRRLGDDEAARVFSSHLRLLRQEAEHRQGRVVKTLGDGIMALFSTAYEAVLAAIDMQQAVEREQRQGKSPAIGLRVGIHVGDVVDDGADDVFGTTVVIARRLCDSASPGQILASDLVRMLAGHRANLDFVAIGALTLKGMAESVPTSEVCWEPLSDLAPLRVVVADDAPLIRAGIVRLLTDEGFEVVGQAADYDSLVALIDRDPPDLVVTDIRMPPNHRDEGLRAAEYLKANHPDVPVLILSQHIEASAAAHLLDSQTAGVGYLLKERVSEVDEFLEAARAVAAGASVIDPLVAEQLLRRQRDDDRLRSLSDREREVLELMARGMSNQAIGDNLYLSPKTVETHVRSIFNKLGLPDDTEVNRRVQAVVCWLETDGGSR